MVEAFIKCSAVPGETLANVHIISGVDRRRALCPDDSCLMHLCSPCHLTSPLEVVEPGWVSEKLPQEPRGARAAVQLFFTRSLFARFACCCSVFPQHSRRIKLPGPELEGGPG